MTNKTKKIKDNKDNNKPSAVIKIKNGSRYELNGWTCVSISGSAYNRGYAHGHLVKTELAEVYKMLKYSLYEDFGRHMEVFIEISNDFFKPKIKDNYPELYEEMEGIARGSNQSVDFIILWNCYVSLEYLYATLEQVLKSRNDSELSKKYENIFEYKDSTHPHPASASEGGGIKQQWKGAPDRCSAFMAVGSYTKDGKIVCAHNTFDNFISGQYCNLIISMTPSKGHRMLFQGAPGYVFSGTDFFTCSSGIFGTETTLGGFNAYENNDPICCRIRYAMQYGNTLDDYVKYLTTNNSGDYASTWYLGDTNTNEIMRIELGLKYAPVTRTKNGYFVGFNAAYDPRIRNLESTNSGFDDIRRHQGARRVRLEQLMRKHRGSIDAKIAKQIIADHYDVYLNKMNLCSRTVCAHYELDDRAFMSQADRPKPFAPRGALDGKVITSDLAREMKFMGIWGSSCGTPFYKDAYCERNLQWEMLKPYLHDRVSQPWTTFSLSARKTKTTSRSTSRSRSRRSVKNNKHKH